MGTSVKQENPMNNKQNLLKKKQNFKKREKNDVIPIEKRGKGLDFHRLKASFADKKGYGYAIAKDL